MVFFTSEIVPTEVKWEKNSRKFTDGFWALLYIANVAAFLVIGFTFTANAKNGFEYIQGDTAVTYIGYDNATYSFYPSVRNPDYVEDMNECCLTLDDADRSKSYNCNSMKETRHRRLALGEMDSYKPVLGPKSGMFDALLMVPHVPVILVAAVLFLSILWVALLRKFAKTMIFTVELVKVLLLVWMGMESRSPIFFGFAATFGMITLWYHKRLIFASTVISHAALGLQQNGAMFIGVIGILLLFSLHALVFTIFIREYIFITKAVKSTFIYESCTDFTDETKPTDCTTLITVSETDCRFQDPSWKGPFLTIFLFTWVWSTQWYNSARLCIISTTIGSWHWHPQRKPTVLQSIAIPFTTSLGTVSLSSLITAIVDQIKRNSKCSWWYCLNPVFLGIWILSWLLVKCVNMITKFTLVIHCFTAQSFYPSAKNCFGIMSRHFKNGFITEVASQNVMTFTSFVFTFGIFFFSWALLDDNYGKTTLPDIVDWMGFAFIFFLCFVGFLLWYPTISILILVMIDGLVKSINTDANTDGEGDNFKVPIVMAAMFVGMIASLLFNYMGGVILDTIDVCFVCFAVDRDNNVDLSGSVFAQQVLKHVPGVKEAFIIGENGQPAVMAVGQTQGYAPAQVQYAPAQVQGFQPIPGYSASGVVVHVAQPVQQTL